MINSDRIEAFVEQVMGHALLAEAFDEEPDRVIDSFIADASPDDIRTVIVEYSGLYAETARRKAGLAEDLTNLHLAMAALCDRYGVETPEEVLGHLPVDVFDEMERIADAVVGELYAMHDSGERPRAFMRADGRVWTYGEVLYAMRYQEPSVG